MTNRSPFKLDTDLITLRSLVAVVEEGGFSAATKRVHRTQSAISLQMAKLEERLHVKLLDRTSRSVSLTPSGETFVSYARRILELADEAVLAVTAPDEQELLRVGFAEYLAPQHLHSLLARFRRSHPHCDLSLVLGSGTAMIKALEHGELDMVFAGPEGENGQLLWEEPLVWTGMKESVDHDGAPLELVLMPPPCWYRQKTFDALARASRPWKLSVEANSVQAVQSAVRAGLGVSVLPLSAVQSDMLLASDSLPALPDTSVMIYVQQDSYQPYARRLIDFLLAGIEENLENRTVMLMQATSTRVHGN
ncbi:LysR family transcriptional regulator [Desulfoplanes formicivorans]|nr:LysR substrate-binding domain-containing protein [Desulfoplanes formicivorans]